LVKLVHERKQLHLHLTSKGHEWLSGGLDEQYAAVYDLITSPAARSDLYPPDVDLFYSGLDSFSFSALGDMRFLGEPVMVLTVKQGKHLPHFWDARPGEYRALRNSLDEALAVLQPGIFYRLDSVESHLVFGDHNPLNLGLRLDQVAVFWGARPVPPLEDQREKAGRRLLDAFVRRRLIPLGCVQAAIDDEGQIGIARRPRYDALFGRKVAHADLAQAGAAAAQVVVQPDFSVVVIGLNPTPVAELAPFCERSSQGGSQGAIVLKVTRKSVIKAVSQGLKPAEIVARLQRHASNEVPANVLREVRDWSQWVREVTSTTLTVLRCPDRDTADRVMGALKRRAERINDTLVAIDPKTMNASERNKLRSQGIIVQGDREDREGLLKNRRTQ
jgi:hypothetical protein